MLLGFTAVAMTAYFAINAGPIRGQVIVCWAAFGLFHGTFAAHSAMVVRAPSATAAGRWVWAAATLAAILFVAGDIAQYTAIVGARWSPGQAGPAIPAALATGTDTQIVLVVAGALVGVAGLLLWPLRFSARRERLRFWLDIGIVMAAGASVSAYSFFPNSGKPVGATLTALLTGPAVFMVGTLAVAKQLMAPQRAFATVTGWILGGACLAQSLASALGRHLAEIGHLSWLLGVAALSSLLLAAASRVEVLRVGHRWTGDTAPVRPFRVLPYLAVGATNALLVWTLHHEGLTHRSWFVIWGDVVATGFVVARQVVALNDGRRLLGALDVQVARLNASLAERDRLSAQLEHLAYHDALTGLANRVLFRRHLGAAIERGGETCAGLTVMLIDLDGFKGVNDRHGHGVGDELLVMVASRLAACADDGDIVARLGGDEFALLTISDADRASALAGAVVDAVGRPFEVNGKSVRVGASVGVATCGAHRCVGSSSDASDLLRAADAAMYDAKRRGKGCYSVSAR